MVTAKNKKTVRFEVLHNYLKRNAFKHYKPYYVTVLECLFYTIFGIMSITYRDYQKLHKPTAHLHGTVLRTLGSTFRPSGRKNSAAEEKSLAPE
jgi:hypothetical protein